VIRQLRRYALITALTASVVTFGIARGQAQTTPGGATLLSEQFLSDAQSAGRNLKIPVDLATREALTLLEEAVRLDPNSTKALKLLSEAAYANANFKLAQDSLLALSKLEPNNLVVQAQFMDALANQKQTVADRIAVYQAALNNPNLDPQVQSVMAGRIGDLLVQQGRNAAASQMYLTAVKLNSANLAAWQQIVRVLVLNNSPPMDRLYALLELLHCDPYQPGALAAGAQILASANDYQQAASWTNAAIQQFQQAGQQLDPALAENLAAYWAIAGQQNLLAPYLNELLALQEPSTQVLMIALTNQTNGSFAVTSKAQGLLQQLHDQLASTMQSDPNQKTDLEIDDAWLDLFYNPVLPSDMKSRVSELGAKSSVVEQKRLEGWLLLRQGRLDAASEQFQAADNDPYALLGLAHIAALKGDKDAEGKILQNLWDSHLANILALDVAQEARLQGITLTQTSDEQAISAAAAAYPDQLLHAADNPSNVVQVTVNWENQFATLGQPIYIDVRYVNTSPWTLAVGPDAGLTTGIALAAASNGLSTTDLGAYAVDSDQQIFRLDPNADVTITYRVDQGVLRELLFNNPATFFSGDLMVVTNPATSGADLLPGLGGQQLDAGDFNVQGYCSGDPPALTETAKSLPTLQGSDQMLTAGTLACVLAGLNANAANASADQQTLMDTLTTAVLNAASNPQAPLTQAWLVRRAPLSGLPDNIASIINSLTGSPNSVVRMASYWRLLALAEAANDPNQLQTAGSQLAGFARTDKDPVASAYASELSAEAAIPPPPPPATPAPAASPAPAPDDQSGQ